MRRRIEKLKAILGLNPRDRAARNHEFWQHILAMDRTIARQRKMLQGVKM